MSFFQTFFSKIQSILPQAPSIKMCIDPCLNYTLESLKPLEDETDDDNFEFSEKSVTFLIAAHGIVGIKTDSSTTEYNQEIITIDDSIENTIEEFWDCNIGDDPVLQEYYND